MKLFKTTGIVRAVKRALHILRCTYAVRTFVNGKTVTHYAINYNDALDWVRCYPVSHKICISISPAFLGSVGSPEAYRLPA